MNSTVRSIFNENFVKKKVCKFHEQCIGLTDRCILQPDANVDTKCYIQTYLKCF